MNETQHSSHQHGTPARDSIRHESAPYWKRAHTDWRFWVGFLCMLAAITIYIMSNDLSFPGSGPRQSPMPAGSRR